MRAGIWSGRTGARQTPRRCSTPVAGTASPVPSRSAAPGPGMTLAVHLRSLRPAACGFTEAGAHHADLDDRLGVTGGPTAFLVWDLDADELTATCGVATTASPRSR